MSLALDAEARKRNFRRNIRSKYFVNVMLDWKCNPWWLICKIMWLGLVFNVLGFILPFLLFTVLVIAETSAEGMRKHIGPGGDLVYHFCVRIFVYMHKYVCAVVLIWIVLAFTETACHSVVCCSEVLPFTYCYWDCLPFCSMFNDPSLFSNGESCCKSRTNESKTGYERFRG